MATEYVGLPGTLLDKAKEAAAQEEISVEELVRDAVEQRIRGKGFSHFFAIGDRNVNRTGAKPEDVQTEVAAYRAERNR